MYKDLIENLKEECNKLVDFTGDYLSNYIEQKEKFKTDVVDIIDVINFNKNFSIAKKGSDRAFYGDRTIDVAKAEVDYYEKIIEQLKKIKEDSEALPDYKISFISNDIKALNRYLENNEIDKLAKMIIIEDEKEDGCIFHFNDICENYAGHSKKFYEYLCAVCDTNCFVDENDENEIEEYKASHFFHLSPEEVVQYAKETIDKD